MVSLKSNIEVKNTQTVENNTIVWEFLIANSSTEFFTSGLGIDTGSRIDYFIIPNGITGTGTLTLQSTIDGVNYYDAQDKEGNPIVVTLNNSYAIEYLIDDLCIGAGSRFKCSGSNTAGSIKILAIQK